MQSKHPWAAATSACGPSRAPSVRRRVTTSLQSLEGGGARKRASRDDFEDTRPETAQSAQRSIRVVLQHCGPPAPASRVPAGPALGVAASWENRAPAEQDLASATAHSCLGASLRWRSRPCLPGETLAPCAETHRQRAWIGLPARRLFLRRRS